MTNIELLNEVKTSLGITGTYQDKTIENYIFEVLEYLSDSGVSDKVLQSESIVGIVVRGVSDLWSFGSGNGELSSYFMMRATQLAYKTEG